MHMISNLSSHINLSLFPDHMIQASFHLPICNDFTPHADPHIDTTTRLQKLPKANGKEKQWSLY
jgi:hypothetical protein